jgi:hypothetical protein
MNCNRDATPDLFPQNLFVLNMWHLASHASASEARTPPRIQFPENNNGRSYILWNINLPISIGAPSKALHAKQMCRVGQTPKRDNFAWKCWRRYAAMFGRSAR